VPFLRAGVDAGETVMVACAERMAALLTDALDGDPRVELVTSPEGFRRTPQAILAYQQLLEHKVVAGARRIRIVGEAGPGEQPADWSE
jgi:hypothetical protein